MPLANTTPSCSINCKRRSGRSAKNYQQGGSYEPPVHFAITLLMWRLVFHDSRCPRCRHAIECRHRDAHGGAIEAEFCGAPAICAAHASLYADTRSEER